MRGFLTFSLIVLTTIASVTSYCTMVSHSNCKDPDNQVPDFLNHEICHGLCSTLSYADQCDFYRFAEPVEHNTLCFHYLQSIQSYIDGCNEISAPRNVDANCFNPQQDTCYMTQSSACQYNFGAVLETLQGNQNIETCQQLCGVDPNCQRWVFYKESSTCTTFSDATQTCKEVFGPPNKTPQQCGKPVPAPTTMDPGPTVTAGPFSCTENTVDLFPKKDDCMSYFQCIEGTMTVERCPDCDYFDPVSKYCKQPISGEVEKACDGRPYDNSCVATTKVGDCPFDYGYFPVTENCKQYKKCDDGNAQYMTCPTQTDQDGVVKQLLYNGDQVQCDWTYRVNCGSRPVCDASGNCQCQKSVPGADPNNPCRGVSGIMIIADPFNCQNKFICRDGTQLDKVVCPPDQYYEIRSDSCKSDEAVCNQNDQYRPICVDGGSGSKQQCRCVDD